MSSDPTPPLPTPLSASVNKLLRITPLTAPGQHSNYVDWSWAAEMHIGASKLGHVLRSVPIKERTSSWEDDNVTVVSMIIQIIDKVNYCYVRPHGKDAAAVWRALKTAHEDNTSGGRLFWLQKLIMTRMNPGEDVMEDTKRMTGLHERLNALITPDKPLTADDIFATSFLISISSDWLLAISHLFQKTEVSSSDVVMAIEREAVRGVSRDDGQLSTTVAVSSVVDRCSFCDRAGHGLAACFAAKRLLQQAMELRLKESSRHTDIQGATSSGSCLGSSSSGPPRHARWRRRKPHAKEKARAFLVAPLESSDEDVSLPSAASVSVVDHNQVVSQSQVMAQRREWLIDTDCSHTRSPYPEDILCQTASQVTIRLANSETIMSSH